MPILILDDGRSGTTDQNCAIDPGEPIKTLTLDANVGFGVTASTGKVSIDDGSTAVGGASTFAQTGGGAATWVHFRPDGTPHGANAAYTLGGLGTGGGGIYLSNSERDAAVVLTPLGATRVFAWNGSMSTWN